MNLKSCVAAAGLLLVSLCSHAGVVYEWRTVDNQTPRGITLQLEFDEAIVNSGSFQASVMQSGMPGEPLPELAPFTLRYAGLGDFRPAVLDFSWEHGFGTGMGLLDLALNFEADGYLSGYIYLNDTERHIMLESTGRLFTVIDADADDGMEWAGCEWASDCGGARGEIRTGALALAEVPEPGSLALFGAGLLGAALRRTRARQAARAART